jgi:hypothetical protein
MHDSGRERDLLNSARRVPKALTSVTRAMIAQQVDVPAGELALSRQMFADILSADRPAGAARAGMDGRRERMRQGPTGECALVRQATPAPAPATVPNTIDPMAITPLPLIRDFETRHPRR